MARDRHGGWSGGGSVDIHRETWRNPETGELVAEDDLPEGAEGWEAVEVTFTFTGSSYFTPGRYMDLPERCYPDEGETEITGWECNHKGLEPTKAEQTLAEEKLERAARDGDFDDFDEPD